MTYSAFDKSSANGQPVELLEIQYGEDDSQIVRTTSGDRDVTVAGKLYRAFTTSRDSFEDEGNPDDSKQLTIKVPRDHPFIIKFDQPDRLPDPLHAAMPPYTLHAALLGGQGGLQADYRPV